MRLFVAVGLDDIAKKAVMARCQQLRSKTPGGHFTTETNLHLTLAFLGETKPAELPALEQALATVRFTAFPMTLKGLGRFASGTKSILYMPADGSEGLPALACGVRSALHGAGIRFDGKPFVAHLTLAREIVIADADLAAVADSPPITTIVRSFRLMESLRETGVLVYRNRREFRADIDNE